MQSKLHPLLQSLALLVVPCLVLLIINYIFSVTGRVENSAYLTASLKMSIFVIPNAFYIILYKYKLGYLGFFVALLATFSAVNSLATNQLALFSTFSLYLINFIYFLFLMGIIYIAYFVVNGFKLKNIIFIIGGVIVHTFSFIGLFSINKIPLERVIIRDIIFRGFNLYLMVGLAIAIGLLFFELPKQVDSYPSDIEDDDL